VITNAIINVPGQVHLAQHADGQSVVVQWVSGSNSPQQLHYSTIKWTSQTGIPSSSSSSSNGSKAHKDIVHSVASSSLTYSQDMMCGEPANSFGFLDPGYLHTAVIPAGDVGHGKKLYYRYVGATECGCCGYSEVGAVGTTGMWVCCLMWVLVCLLPVLPSSKAAFQSSSKHS
jgi:hypothetical protein